MIGRSALALLLLVACSSQAGAQTRTDSLRAWLRESLIPIDLAAPPEEWPLQPSLFSGARLIGLGEQYHSDEGHLVFRNHLFERLVREYGTRAIVLESAMPEAEDINAYGNGADLSYAQLADSAFGYGFGGQDANHRLVEWIRSRNAVADPADRIGFFGMSLSSQGSGQAAPPQRVWQRLLGHLANLDTDPTLDVDHIGRLLDRVFPFGALDPDAVTEADDLKAHLERLRDHLVVKGSAGGEPGEEYEAAARIADATLNTVAILIMLADPTPVGWTALDSTYAANIRWVVEHESGNGPVFVHSHNDHLWTEAVRNSDASFDGTLLMGHFLREWFGESFVRIGTVIIHGSETVSLEEPAPNTMEWVLGPLVGGAALIDLRRMPAGVIKEAWDALVPRDAGPEAPLSFGTERLTDFEFLLVLPAAMLAERYPGY
jgi:erythromycin esterase-like protein